MDLGPECQYSFEDLFFAAFGRKASLQEIEEFNQLSQESKNQKVKEWAGLADWNVVDRVGVDEKVYTAFYPKWGKRVF
jgi:hypothetical protein